MQSARIKSRVRFSAAPASILNLQLLILLQPKLQQKQIVVPKFLLQMPQLLTTHRLPLCVSSRCYRYPYGEIQSTAKPKRICRPYVNLLFNILTVAKTGHAHSMCPSKRLFFIIWPPLKTKAISLKALCKQVQLFWSVVFATGANTRAAS